MNIIYPLVFRFGNIKKELITEPEWQSYNLLVTGILGKKNYAWASEKGESLNILNYSIPIYKQQSQENAGFLGYRFLKWAYEETRIAKANTRRLIDSQTVILIDLRGIDRDQQIYHLTYQLRILIEGEKSLKAILIFDRLPVYDDFLFKHVFYLKEAGIIEVVDNTASEFSKSYKTKLEYSDTVQRLSGKLIRKLGHFKSSKNKNICRRYFYDGRYCDEEIRELTLDYISRLNINKDELEYIFYISKESPWLKTSMSVLSGNIEFELKEDFNGFKGAYNIEKLSHKIIKNYGGGHIILVADFLNTSNTLKESVVTVREKLIGLNRKKLHLISIINNIRRGGKPSTGFRDIKIEDDNYRVKYFVDVELEESPSSECDQCELDLGQTDTEKEDVLRMRSFDFWDLASKSKYETEQVKPILPDRKQIYTPKFSLWLDNHAAYLVYKFNKFIDENYINTSLNFVVIYPEEKVTKSKDGALKFSASGLFARKLNEILKVNIIGIPRIIIDKVSKGQLGYDSLSSINEDWKTDIVEIPPKTDIIILDEFHKGGSTIKSIRGILEYLGSPAKGYFSIADFNPEKGETYSQDDGDFKYYNLYEFNIN